MKTTALWISFALAGAACATTATTPATDSAPQPASIATTAQLTVELAARRAQMISWLHDYHVAGQFPTDRNGMPLSVFRDAHGVLCPMAALIHRSGRTDLVEGVVATNNTITLADVHTGPLADWMATSGLTRTEIAMIQGAPRDFEAFQWNQELRIEFTSRDTRMASAAAAQVRGRLETAEVALRNNTSASLPVVVAEAITSGPVHRDRATRVAAEAR